MPESAIVTLQLGQCGNQLGHEMFATLAREAAGGDSGGGASGVGSGGGGGRASVDELLPQYFRRGSRGQQAPGGAAGTEGGLDDGAAVPVARSVLVDMEPKVIWQASGAGNNWAYGFAVHGPAASDAVMELVRKEVEHCDRLGGLMLLQSLAGGTGSGVGTYLTETLRDHYPHANLLNHTVWPYESGEVIVQHYNAMLTLAKVVELADATLYSENEQLDNLCRRMLNLPKPTFDHLNQVIASQLAHLCLPATLSIDSRDEQGSERPVEHMVDVVRHCCPCPRYRLLSLRTLPQLPRQALQWEGRQRWRPMLGNLRQMLLADSLVEQRANWQIGGDSMSPKLSGRGLAGMREDATADSELAASSVNRSCASMVFLRGDLSADEASSDDNVGGSPSHSSRSKYGGSTGGSGASIAPVLGPGPVEEARRAFQVPGVHSGWAEASGDAVAVATSPHSVGGHSRSVAVLSNSQSVIRPLDRLIGAAAAMMHEGGGAYLHHYAKHGVGRDVFEDALATTEQILHDYRQL